MWYLQQCRYHFFCIYPLEDEFEIRAAFFRFLENLRREYFSPHSPSVQIQGQSENSVAILLSGYSFVSLRHETMASITDSIS